MKIDVERDFILAVLSSPKTEVSKVEIKPIWQKDQVVFQMLTYQNNQVTHKTIEADEVIPLINNLMSQFKNGIIYTQIRDYHLFCNRLGEISIKGHAPQKKKVISNHNKEKNYLLPQNEFIPFLYELGIISSNGEMKKDKFSKFKQINRFLEFIDDIADELPNPMRIVDFGCGKSYLTFAIHYYFNNIKERQVEIIGLDLKSEVIKTCSALVDKYHLTGIRFEQGNIRDFTLDHPVDLVVSLHACDTATDYALFQAISWQAKAILAVPCCHKELNQNFVTKQQIYTKYGIVQERMATLVTDLTRCALLKQNGYKTQMLEFISLEHTPKNVLIRAVKVKKEFNVDEELKELQENFPYKLTLQRLLENKHKNEE